MDLFAPLTSLVFVAIAYIAGSVKIINEGEAALVERFGRYQRTLAPGLNFTLPIVDTIVIDTTREQVFDVPPQDAVTRDGVSLKADAVVFWEIKDLYKVHYNVDDVKEAIENFVLTNLRTAVSQMSLMEVLSARSDLNNSLLAELNEVTDDWGVNIRRVDVKDIDPSESVIRSMEQRRVAEDTKASAILEAQGKKQAAIEEAESRKVAAIYEAEGIRDAVQRIAEAVQSDPQQADALKEVIRYLIAQRYVAASEKIGESNNSKVIFMDPHNLTDALDSLIAGETSTLPGGGGNPNN
ncbi:MAG: SPFH/Band 7/PHB domain protein [Synechococcales cyanobacterium RM1_1_8]|nr:SPFH/Band 7/PHB domain protein [Synechococcales cyanobacterium RM1_1_8]